MNGKHFQRHGRGVFTCSVCGRSTRQVNQGDSECCPECFELAGYDNMHNDNGTAPTAKELAFYEAELAAIVAKGGDADRIRKEFPYIWRS